MLEASNVANATGLFMVVLIVWMVISHVIARIVDRLSEGEKSYATWTWLVIVGLVAAIAAGGLSLWFHWPTNEWVRVVWDLRHSL